MKTARLTSFVPARRQGGRPSPATQERPGAG